MKFAAARTKYEPHSKRKNGFATWVEKHGLTVPIYRVRSGNGYISFVISYRENGAPKRLGFPTVGEVRTPAKLAAKDIAAAAPSCRSEFAISPVCP